MFFIKYTCILNPNIAEFVPLAWSKFWVSYSFSRVNSLVPDVRTKSVSVSTASAVFQCLSLQGRPVVWHTQSASPIFHCHIAVQHIFLEGTDLKVSSECISPDNTQQNTVWKWWGECWQQSTSQLTYSFRVIVKVFGDYEIYLILSDECLKLRRTMVPGLFGLKLWSLYLKSQMCTSQHWF